MDIFGGTGLASLGGQAPRAQSLGDFCPKVKSRFSPTSWVTLLLITKLDWILIRMMDVHNWDISEIGTTHSPLEGA